MGLQLFTPGCLLIRSSPLGEGSDVVIGHLLMRKRNDGRDEDEERQEQLAVHRGEGQVKAEDS